MIENLFSRIFEKTHEARKACERRILGESGTIKDMEDYKFSFGKKQGILECEAILHQIYQELYGSAMKENEDKNNGRY